MGKYSEAYGVEIHGITGQEINEGRFYVRELTSREAKDVPDAVSAKVERLNCGWCGDGYNLLLSTGNTYVAVAEVPS